jgi:uncharacterized protein YqgC (DUF456 family)
MDAITLLAAVIVLVGFAGIFLPALPGIVLILAGIAVWAVPQNDPTAWSTLVVCTVIAVAGLVLQYVIPGHRMADQGVPGTTLLSGALLGFVGFFVVPVAGVFIGFVAGVWLAEYARLGSAQLAWPSTRAALAAVGWSILIEFAAGMIMTATWVGVMIFAY